jgi:hypothetical protein
MAQGPQERRLGEGSTGTPAAVPLRPDDPAAIGGYRLLGRLAAGGMGMVYLAEDPDGRLVALKTVLPHYSEEPELRARFVREAEVARRLSGRWTPALLAADTRARQQWLALVHVPGPTLAERVGAGRALSAAEVGELADGLARALEELHGLGLVHRDLKPANIICSPQGPRVIDFGIATGEQLTSITRTGLVIATQLWAAPEQFDGPAVGPAADVFAWGLVVSYAALGRHPFVAAGEQAAHDVVLARMRSGRYDSEALRRALPGKLAALVVAALQPVPANRPDGARLLGAPGPAAAPPPGDEERAALKAWSEAAYAGDLAAAFHVARLLEERFAAPVEAEGWYRHCAAAGMPAACTALGRIEAARGSTAAARQWYVRGAAGGDAAAAAAVDDLDRAEATSAPAGPPTQPGQGAEALFQQGWTAWERQDAGTALRCWREAADQGHARAAFNVGWLLEKHFARRDQAEQWYLRSAADGAVEAMAKLGRLALAQGRPAAAEVWMGRAAAHGDTTAQQALAQLQAQQVRRAG